MINPVFVTLLVAVAGGIGSVARFMLDGVLRAKVQIPSAFPLPLGTMVINVSGSLLLGFLAGLVLFHAVPQDWRIVLGTGFLGGYTTFSTASIETVRLSLDGHYRTAVINGLGMLLLALAAAAAGFGIAAAV